MMEFSHYQQLYVGTNFSDATAPKTSDSKDIILLHLEFTVTVTLGSSLTQRL
jgi:hypothetical protein